MIRHGCQYFCFYLNPSKNCFIKKDANQLSVLGQRVASKRECFRTFQGMTPSLSSGYCWWLVGTKTDDQMSCNVQFISPFGMGAG